MCTTPKPQVSRHENHDRQRERDGSPAESGISAAGTAGQKRHPAARETAMTPAPR